MGRYRLDKFPMTDIKIARLKQGITAKQLGELVGVSAMTISHYETGKRTPSKEMLSRIKVALNMDDTEERVEIGSDELTRAAMPLVELLRKKGHPHMTVLVTSTSCELVEMLKGTPLFYDD